MNRSLHYHLAGTECSKLGIVSLVVLKQPSRCQNLIVWGMKESEKGSFFPFKIMSYVHIPTNLQVKAQSLMFRCRKQARSAFHILLVQTYSRFRLFKGTEVTVEYIGHAMCFGEKLCFSKVSEEKNSQRAQVALNRWVWCKVRGWVYFDGHDKTLKSIGFIRIT